MFTEGNPMKFNTKIDYLALIKKECIRTRLIHTLAGILSSVFLFFNSIICVPLLIPPALIKSILPLPPVKRVCMRIRSLISVIWISNNTFLFTKILGLRIETGGEHNFSMDEWYMVICNHQSWIDIIALQTVLNRKTPPLRFFTGKGLIRIPVIGAAARALDFPFIKKYSPDFIKAAPRMKRKKTTCSDFQILPVSIMDFAEGTRFTQYKHYRQSSPFANLLKPGAGRIGLVLTTMGEQINSILDITIKYIGDDKKFWSLMCGRIKHIKMHIEKIPMSDKFKGDYAADPLFRKRIHKWLNELWIKKDRMLEVM